MKLGAPQGASRRPTGSGAELRTRSTRQTRRSSEPDTAATQPHRGRSRRAAQLAACDMEDDVSSEPQIHSGPAVR